jgi:hypothetical protein
VEVVLEPLVLFLQLLADLHPQLVQGLLAVLTLSLMPELTLEMGSLLEPLTL